VSLQKLIFPFRYKKSKSNDRLFLCDIGRCGKKFNRQYELARHKSVVHDKGPRFPCPIPDCRFSTLGAKGPFGRKDNLRAHIRNTHPEIDLLSIEGLQQAPFSVSQPDTDNKLIENEELGSQDSVARLCQKRKHIFSTINDNEEAQESSCTESKRLCGMIENLREVIRQREEDLQRLRRVERELADLIGFDSQRK
jgi:hypothetical protein